MGTVVGVQVCQDAELIKTEVDAVLASDLFSRAPSLAQFLSYVCRKALGGEADQIKEYNIAVEAFGREPDFDQKADAIVRVEAHRLRKRLKQYYEGEGADHALQIVMPAGQYVPLFIAVQPAVENQALVVAEGREPVPAVQQIQTLSSDAGIPAPVPVEPAALSVQVVSPAPRRTFHGWAIAAIILLAVTAGLIGVVVNRNANQPSQSTASQPFATAPSQPSPGRPAAEAVVEEEGIRIAAGLTSPKYVDSLGNTWMGDRYFLGGKVLAGPAERILRTRDPVLFQNRREGDFRYDIPLDPGVYELHLLFAERVFGTGNLAGGGETSRLFHIFANGSPIIEMLDVISDAGGNNTANIRIFKDVSPAPDGFLHLRFSPYKENAFVNGIAILPAQPGRMRPIRMVAGDASVRDASSRLWMADQYFSGGQTIVRTAPVSGTDRPELYHSERYGNFSYAIPVADGRYSITLHFSEAWFGKTKPGGGGAGSRAFDVYCNGAALLKNFDIFKSAGGGNRAVERTFHGLTPNAQGKLLLSFVPVKNYALVNAVEVTAEEK